MEALGTGFFTLPPSPGESFGIPGQLEPALAPPPLAYEDWIWK